MGLDFSRVATRLGGDGDQGKAEHLADVPRHLKNENNSRDGRPHDSGKVPGHGQQDKVADIAGGNAPATGWQRWRRRRRSANPAPAAGRSMPPGAPEPKLTEENSSFPTNSRAKDQSIRLPEAASITRSWPLPRICGYTMARTPARRKGINSRVKVLSRGLSWISDWVFRVSQL